MEYDCVNTRARKEENKHWKGHILSYAKRKDGFEAEISGHGSNFHLIVGETRHGNYLCIPTWEVGSELADYNDTFWNQEQISRQLSAVDSITLANGIKAIGMLLK